MKVVCSPVDPGCDGQEALLLALYSGALDPVPQAQLALGGHACVLTASGAVRCWGLGLNGRLGYGNLNNIGDNETPASAGDVDVGGSVEHIAAGATASCARLKSSGALRCWGAGGGGQLGLANLTSIGDNETPASVGSVDVGGAVEQLTIGNGYICARLADGSLRCWGSNGFGQLGYGNTLTIGDNETPASAGAVPVGPNVASITAGFLHVCAVLNSGAIRCWGFGSDGRLGYGNTTDIGDDETPASAGDVNVGGAALQVAVGTGHSCALLATGAVRCWGDAASGQLGYGNTTDIGDDESPASAGDVNVGGPVKQIAAGGEITCALLVNGAVRCWGNGFSGALGYGNTTNIGDNETPASAGDVNIGGPVKQIAVGGSFACALLESDAVRCWGSGNGGQLGYGNTTNIGDNETPASAGDVPYR